MSEITIPKINSRQKGLQIQFYTTIPTKYSETGKRHQITGASENEVKKKFRKEARRTITGQVDDEPVMYDAEPTPKHYDSSLFGENEDIEMDNDILGGLDDDDDAPADVGGTGSLFDDEVELDDPFANSALDDDFDDEDKED